MKTTNDISQELNKLPKDIIIKMYLDMSANFDTIRKSHEALQVQNNELIKKVNDLNEKLAILIQNRFGKKTESGINMPGQLTFDVMTGEILNEAESLTESGLPEEPDIEKVVTRRRKKKGKRAANLEGVEVEIVNHECEASVLAERFPEGYHELEDEVYSELTYIPAQFKVLEHHIKIYAGNHDVGGILRADSPNRLLAHSILTPELAAAVFNAKYVNAVPFNRLSEEFLRQDVNIPRQDLAGWMIRIWKYYLSPVYDRMKAEIFKARYLHCDETPFVMPSHSKEYMWVFHSPGENGSHPVFLYEHLGARNGTVLQEYMKGYHGTIVTDGYQPYHTLMKYSDDIKVAGCWSHSRRMYAEIVKAMPKDANPTPAQAIACEAVKRIDAMYHMDSRKKGSSLKEKLDNRKQSVKPLVDAYFAWIKTKQQLPCSSSKLKEAMNYAVYQEKYLRRFLDDPELPMDNNDAERSIRSFCVGKHNWHIIDSVNGAKASAFLYSIAESAKANGLKPYEYFRYLLSELVKHPRDNVPEDVLNRIMPWSEELPDCCRKTKTR